MRFFLIVLFWVPFGARGAGLEPLAFLAGNCWNAPGENGQVETHCYRFDYGDRFLKDELTVSKDGRAIYRGETVYRTDPNGTIRWIYFGASGGWMEGLARPEGGIVEFPPADWVGPDGTRLTMRVRWSELSFDGFTSVTESLSGEDWVESARRVFSRGEPSQRVTGRYLFKSRRDGNDELYLWTPDDVTRLTVTPQHEHWPSPSPDGRRLAWFRVDGNIRNLYLGRLEQGRLGDVRAFLPSNGQDLIPSWSPDGQWIAFFSSREEGGIEERGLMGHVYVARPDGSELRRLSAELVESTAIGWRPDGQGLAYKAGNQLVVQGLDGTAATELALDGLSADFVGHPSYSPNGKFIAFHAQHGNEAHLYRVPADGGRPERITRRPGLHYAPQWSADGRWILFTGSKDGANYGVWAVLPSGGGFQVVFDSPQDDRLAVSLP